MFFFIYFFISNICIKPGGFKFLKNRTLYEAVTYTSIMQLQNQHCTAEPSINPESTHKQIIAPPYCTQQIKQKNMPRCLHTGIKKQNNNCSRNQYMKTYSRKEKLKKKKRQLFFDYFNHIKNKYG